MTKKTKANLKATLCRLGAVRSDMVSCDLDNMPITNEVQHMITQVENLILKTLLSEVEENLQREVTGREMNEEVCSRTQEEV